MKKRIRYIIPPSFYKKKEVKRSSEKKEVDVSTSSLERVIQKKPDSSTAKPELPKKQEVVTPSTTPVVTPKKEGVTRRRSSSALSLNSLKREKEKVVAKKKVDYSNMPKEKFSRAAFDVNWNTYIDMLNRQGNKMLASILGTSKPVLKDVIIEVTYPNSMMAEELKKHQSGILNFLREKLQNYQISFNIIVDEKEEKTYAYSPQDKYNKLYEINPLIEEMRKILFLDI